MTSPYGERLHPCASGHDWDNGAGSQWARCTRCQEMTKLPPMVASPAPPGAGPMRTPPPQPDLRAGGRMSVQDAGYLRMAARWGLLRQIGRKRLMLTGEFSLPLSDLVELVKAAGAVVDPSASIPDLTVDAVVYGDEPNADLLELAMDHYIETWDEAELVSRLLPTLESLTAEPGQPPF